MSHTNSHLYFPWIFSLSFTHFLQCSFSRKSFAVSLYNFQQLSFLFSLMDWVSFGTDKRKMNWISTETPRTRTTTTTMKKNWREKRVQIETQKKWKKQLNFTHTNFSSFFPFTHTAERNWNEKTVNCNECAERERGENGAIESMARRKEKNKLIIRSFWLMIFSLSPAAAEAAHAHMHGRVSEREWASICMHTNAERVWKCCVVHTRLYGWEILFVITLPIRCCCHI